MSHGDPLRPVDPATTRTHATTVRERRLLLIVVGSNIAAEIGDRPLAQRLLAQVAQHLTREGWCAGSCTLAVQPVVCTDLWYLNDRALDGQPVIAVGEPARNAATAMLCTKLPTAMVIDRSFRVHVDPEFMDEQPSAAMWGLDAASTQAAIDAFVERYLDGFLAAIARSDP